MLFPKGPTRASVKREEGRERARARAACVAEVWARAGRRCDNPFCRRVVVEPRGASWLGAAEVGHVHEIVPRSRGGDPTDAEACVLVCTDCHARLHRRLGRRLEIARAGERRVARDGERSFEDHGRGIAWLE